MFAKKSLGQNFLMHRRTAERIADVSGISSNDTVLEIGPGTGMLTLPLLERSTFVIAIEADENLSEELHNIFKNEISIKKLEIQTKDIRKFDPATITKPYILVANIPYYITGEIIRKFLETSNKPKSMTLLVQKEVAIRIARDTKESLLSLSVKAYGNPKYEFTVPRGAFIPAPKVDSAVISIKNISTPFKDTSHEERFFTILHAGFAHKRKKLLKNLSAISKKEPLLKTFSTLKISIDARAEDIHLDTWIELSNKIDLIKG